MKKAAVILSGCGAKDGSEIHEATLLLYALSKEGFNYSIFAPNKSQYDVINHITDSKEENTRNVLIESARIARGKISPLTELKCDDFDILAIPGGFGAAKNLFTYAYDGLNFTVDSDVESIVKEFYSKKKPIGAMCIAPVMIAKILGPHSVKLTLGELGELSTNLSKLTGTIIVDCKKGDVTIDSKNKLVTTPAYMHGDSTISEIGAGAEKLVKELNKLL